MLYMSETESKNEDMEGANEPLTKKKPRSAKQIESFKLAMEKRAANIAIKKEEKLVKASEILVNKAKKETVEPIPEVSEAKASPLPAPPQTPKPRAKTMVQESDSEEEVIIVKSKPKKKVKKIIIESSDSDSDSSGSDGGTPQQQQYVQRQVYVRPTFNSENYFI